VLQCRDGKVHQGVTLRSGNAAPDVTGTVVDSKGDPVPFAFVDISPLDPGVPHGQLERADARGVWHVYALQRGRYQIDAYSPGRGVLSTMIVAPRRDVVLQLGGTGRLSGTTTELVNGSFELVLHHCGPSANPTEIEDDARLVAVRGGHFSIDRVPACALTFSARWRDRLISQTVVIEPDRTSFVDLELGTPREKTVHGTVRDGEGNPAPKARVTALVDNKEAVTIRADESGAFTLQTHSGARLVAGNGNQVGGASVGRANVASERVDIVLGVGGE
jgi:hypothetical protein